MQSITRPIGRVRIETQARQSQARITPASPGQLAGCGLKLQGIQRPYQPVPHHPANWPGAD
ncbi:hypothetical protein SFMTTN_2959 [Sulfuriferula multivorans]|uniref:Uncharacterized protein n=1 Tax=Sulfuriferula multivorans TaxID=1559896 RepID=A0A401JZR1_9PROT|nr:hypothetical protein SFMTTN_2959 [Sulfuriferula multivorans]